MYSFDKGGALTFQWSDSDSPPWWCLMYFIYTYIPQGSTLGPLHLTLLLMDGTFSMLKYASTPIKLSICLRSLPLHGCCHFIWHFLSAICRGTASHNSWQRPFLIHKSQKDGYKIHEQSVLQQPVISVTVGQWRHAATERKALPPMIFSGTQTCKHRGKSLTLLKLDELNHSKLVSHIKLELLNLLFFGDRSTKQIET